MEFLEVAEQDDLTAAGTRDVDHRRSFAVHYVKLEGIFWALLPAFGDAADVEGHVIFGLGVGQVVAQQANATQEGVVFVEDAEGVKRAIADLGVGL